MLAGEHSLAKIGTVEPLAPIPTPRSSLTMKSCCQFWVNALPMGVMSCRGMERSAATLDELKLDELTRMMAVMLSADREQISFV